MKRAQQLDLATPLYRVAERCYLPDETGTLKVRVPGEIVAFNGVPPFYFEPLNAAAYRAVEAAPPRPRKNYVAPLAAESQTPWG